jgi:nitrogen fixation protein FixH
VLAMFVGFFIVVAAVNAYMMTQALRTMPGLEARNGYDVSQRFNGEIRAAQVQTQRGWTVDAIVDRAWVDVSFRDAGQRGLGDLAVEVRLVNPTDRSLDRIVGLETERTGRYVASIAPLKPGTWDITITAVKDGERVFLSRHRKTIKA